MTQNLLFFNIDFPKIPTIPELVWPTPPIGNSTVSKSNHSVLTDEVNDLISSVGLEVAFVILWTWNERIDGRERYSIHSDGRYDDPLQRRCAMNWNLNGSSVVEWWSTKNSVPRISQKDDAFFKVTHWDYTTDPVKIAEWDGCHPAVLDIRHPHSVRVISGPRRSITVRFKGLHSMEDMQALLKEHLIPSYPGI